MNRVHDTAAASFNPATAATPQASGPVASLRTLPAWVARVDHESPHRLATSRPAGSGPRVSESSARGGLSGAWRLLRDPQSWITAIAVLTLVGLSGGAFEAEDAPRERSALHAHNGMTNDAIVAELSSQQR